MPFLDRFFNRGVNQPCQKYLDARTLVEGLQQEEASAISCLTSKIAKTIYHLGKKYQLTDEDIEELQCDCILLFIEKIKGGKYKYQEGTEPSTYVMEIAKNKVRNFRRKNQRTKTAEFSLALDYADESDYGSLEQVEHLEKLLSQLGENCQNLIRLKYLEGVNDKDAIEQKRTQYTTVDALKNHRAQCMKKLTALAAQYKKNK